MSKEKKKTSKTCGVRRVKGDKHRKQRAIIHPVISSSLVLRLNRSMCGFPLMRRFSELSISFCSLLHKTVSTIKVLC
uniref:Uncharacterized protein n=1 Tax=Oryza brachyantha TaxID=4533 RepID=J3MTQ5_ORYBR